MMPSFDEIQENTDFDINYLVVVYNEQSIYHLCGYEFEPTHIDINQLKHELSEDTEFGLAGDINTLNSMQYHILNTNEYEQLCDFLTSGV